MVQSYDASVSTSLCVNSAVDGLCSRAFSEVPSLVELLQEMENVMGLTWHYVWVGGVDFPEYLKVIKEPPFRGYHYSIQWSHPYRVELDPVGFVNSYYADAVLTYLHVLQTKIPTSSPDLLGVDWRVSNCLGATLLLYKNPVIPKILLIPFNPLIPVGIEVTPRFEPGSVDGGIEIDRALNMQCSLSSVISEVLRIKGGRGGGGWTFFGIADKMHAIFVRADIMRKTRDPANSIPPPPQSILGSAYRIRPSPQPSQNAIQPPSHEHGSRLYGEWLVLLNEINDNTNFHVPSGFPMVDLEISVDTQKKILCDFFTDLKIDLLVTSRTSLFCLSDSSEI